MATAKQTSNPLALAVLVLLFERPMHPYEIGAMLRLRSIEKSVKLRYGSLYTVIEALQQERLIVPRETVREGRRPERTIYALTPSGIERMRTWVRELLGTPTKEYPQFEAGLTFLGVIPPDEAVTLLEARCVRLGEIAEGLRATVEAASGYVERLFLIEAEYHLALIETERQFVEDFIRRIKEDADYVKNWKSFHARPGPEGAPTS